MEKVGVEERKKGKKRETFEIKNMKNAVVKVALLRFSFLFFVFFIYLYISTKKVSLSDYRMFLGYKQDECVAGF